MFGTKTCSPQTFCLWASLFGYSAINLNFPRRVEGAPAYQFPSQTNSSPFCCQFFRCGLWWIIHFASVAIE